MSNSTATHNNIQSLVLRATDDSLQSEDWDTIVQICDLLMQKPDETAVPVIQSVIQRLQTTNSPHVQKLVLTLLDSCVKNASDYFHQQLCRPKYLSVIEAIATQPQKPQQDLLDLLNTSTTPESHVAQQFKDIIKDWNREFGARVPEFRNSLARVTGQQPALSASAAGVPQHVSQQPAAAPISPKVPMEKLRDDVKAVRNASRSLREMVTAARTVQDIKSDNCIQTIVNCREMHRRLIRLIESVPEEQLLLELIELNDDLYNAIEEHDAFKRTGQKQQLAAAKGKDRAVEQGGDLLGLAGAAPSSSSSSHIYPQHAAASSGGLDFDDIFGAPAPHTSTHVPASSTNPFEASPNFGVSGSPSPLLAPPNATGVSVATRRRNRADSSGTAAAVNANPATQDFQSFLNAHSSTAPPANQQQRHKSNIKQPANADDLLF